MEIKIGVKKEIKINEKRKSVLENIKSVFILNEISKFLKKSIFLEIIKINKNIQKRYGINKNYYKEFSEQYTPIELEIIPLNMERYYFINIKDGDESYYHIYFNDNKKEVKRNYFINEKVNKIKIVIDPQIKSFDNLFENLEIIKSINFTKFHRNNIIILVV